MPAIDEKVVTLETVNERNQSWLDRVKRKHQKQQKRAHEEADFAARQKMANSALQNNKDQK